METCKFCHQKKWCIDRICDDCGDIYAIVEDNLPMVMKMIREIERNAKAGIKRRNLVDLVAEMEAPVQ